MKIFLTPVWIYKRHECDDITKGHQRPLCLYKAQRRDDQN